MGKVRSGFETRGHEPPLNGGDHGRNGSVLTLYVVTSVAYVLRRQQLDLEARSPLIFLFLWNSELRALRTKAGAARAAANEVIVPHVMWTQNNPGS